MRRLKTVGKNVALYVAMAFALFPIYWLIVTSLKSQVDIFAVPPVFWPTKATLANFQTLLGERQFGRYLVNSLAISGTSVLLAMAAGSFGAYSLARFRLPKNLSNHLAFWILSTRMLPPIVVVIPMYLILSSLRLIDTWLGLIVVYTGFNLPIVVWMMRGFFEEIPVDLEEAAMVDGDSRLTAFLKIVLPLASPGLIATMIFCLIVTWNEFIYALVLSSTMRAMTLPVGTAALMTKFKIIWGEMAAAGVIAIIPIMIFALIVQKHLIRGLTMGAIK